MAPDTKQGKKCRKKSIRSD